MRLSKGVPTKILFTLCSSVLILSCGGSDEKPSDATSGTPIHVTHPSTVNMTDYLSLNGNIIFLKKEILRSTFDGFVEKVYKNIGDAVNSGEPVFQLKTKEWAASDSASVSIGDRLFQGSVFIKAGSAGTLTEVDFHEGDYVTAGEQLAIISNPSSLRVRLNVPFEDISKVNIVGSCEVDLPNREVFPGSIEKSVPSVDMSTQTQTYLIRLRTLQSLPENLNVIVRVPVASFKHATVLPKSSIMTNVTQDEFWIMKLINDTTAVRVNINKGIENDSVVQVVSPELNSLERIVTNGGYGLPDTAEVEIMK